MRDWLDRLLTWDEQHDGTPRALLKLLRKEAPLTSLTATDKQLLEVIADGDWVHEDDLRKRLGW